jgi:DNA-binding FadR family transcriptional regulator
VGDRRRGVVEGVLDGVTEGVLDGAVRRADDAVFRPVRSGNAYEETVGRLLQAIRLGVVPPGERLPAGRELAARLGVSRVTLREALGTLQSTGYLEVRLGRYGGTFVRDPLPTSRTAPARRADQRVRAELDDVLLLRQVLEAGAAESAAERSLTRAEREHLTGRLAACSAVELCDYRRLDSRLHLAVAELAGSPSLTATLTDVRTRLNELLESMPLMPPNLEHSNRQHAAVVSAILAGDPAGARRAMTEHLAGTEALLRGFLA